MSVEWVRRIERYKEELISHFFEPVSNLEFEAFETFDELKLTEVKDKEFKPVKNGWAWGKKWQYVWFRSKYKPDASVRGKKMAIFSNVGGEQLFFINDKTIGSIDRFHKYIPFMPVDLSEVSIYIEAYAGHGIRNGHLGPFAKGRRAMEEFREPANVLGLTHIGIWNEEIYQLFLDVETLWGMYKSLDKNTLIYTKVFETLKNFTYTIDFESGLRELKKTAKKASLECKAVLDRHNGSSNAKMYAIGHSHLDVKWKWTLKETRRKIQRTLSNQCFLLENYPEYKYVQTQPYLLKLLKESNKTLYKRVKEYIQSGRIIPEGGMYVESDTNMPSGESLIRQLIWGRNWILEEYGIETQICWLVDVFGYSPSLPQILKRFGIKYFTSSKIFLNYNGGEEFPYHSFMWKGIDGTRIKSHFFKDYNAHTKTNFLIQRYKDKADVTDGESFLYPFGYGDGGGGALRDHVEFIRRSKDLEGVPKTSIKSPMEFFDKSEEENQYTNEYYGEIYYKAHRGTYTSQARTKKGNRKSEIAIRELEILAWALKTNETKCYPKDILDKCFEKLLVNQFHDILPGTSIRQVHVQAQNDYEWIQKNVNRTKDELICKYIDYNNQYITIFNSLSWDRTVDVKCPKDAKYLIDSDNNIYPAFKQADETYARVKLSRLSFCVFKIKKDNYEKSFENKTSLSIKKDGLGYFVSNESMDIKINHKGEITNLLDKKNKWPINKKNINELKLYKDIPTMFDAWDIDSMYKEETVSIEGKSSIKIKSVSKKKVILIVEREFSSSIWTQRIIIDDKKPMIIFKTKVEWNELHKLLKVSFPFDVESEKAKFETQFGYHERPIHNSTKREKDMFEVCMHKWACISESNRNVFLLNDSKYGISAKSSSFDITLLKAPRLPDTQADKGIHEFTYSIYFDNVAFIKSDGIKKAYELNISPTQFLGVYSRNDAKLIDVEKENIIVETIKKAEDENGFIVRLYESKKTKTKTTIKLNCKHEKVIETDLAERNEKEKIIKDNEFEAVFKPLEIKSFRII